MYRPWDRRNFSALILQSICLSFIPMDTLFFRKWPGHKASLFFIWVQGWIEQECLGPPWALKMCHIKDSVGFWRKSPLTGWEGGTSYTQVIALTHKKLTLLGAGGYGCELYTARLLGTYAGLWEEKQFKNVPPVVQAETLCKVTWPIRTCLTHFSLKIAFLFGPFGWDSKSMYLHPNQLSIFSGLSMGLSCHSNPINSIWPMSMIVYILKLISLSPRNWPRNLLWT